MTVLIEMAPDVVDRATVQPLQIIPVESGFISGPDKKTEQGRYSVKKFKINDNINFFSVELLRYYKKRPDKIKNIGLTNGEYIPIVNPLNFKP